MNQHQRFQETVINSRNMLDVSISLAMKRFEEVVKNAQSKFDSTVSNSRHILLTSIKISKQSLEDVIHEVERKADVPPDQNSDSITPIRNTSNESTVREERGFEEPGPSFENTNGTLTLRQTETLIKEEPLDQSYENTQNSIVTFDQNLK